MFSVSGRSGGTPRTWQKKAFCQVRSLWTWWCRYLQLDPNEMSEGGSRKAVMWWRDSGGMWRRPC